MTLPLCRTFALSLAWLLLTSPALQADIYSVPMAAGGIEAEAPTPVRMESARVVFTWQAQGFVYDGYVLGDNWRLEADFRMHNTSAEVVQAQVAFPLVGQEILESLHPPVSLTFRVDGAQPMEVAETIPLKHNAGMDWRAAPITFAPGETHVAVQTIYPEGSPGKGVPFGRRLRYTVLSGGSWAGTIGVEDVIVRFPEPILPGQILSAEPAGYRIEGNDLIWTFREFEPVDASYDIDLFYTTPVCVAVIHRLQRELAADPTNDGRALELAKHLLPLTPYYSSIALLSAEMTAEELEGWCARIDQPEDRELVRQWHSAAQQFEHSPRRQMDGQLSQLWVNALQILRAAGYTSAKVSPYAVEAEGLLREVLARDPRNAEAWSLYLTYWSQMRCPVYGGEWDPQAYSAEQRAMIETAHRQCPRRRYINLFYFSLTSANPEAYPERIREAKERLHFLQPLQFAKAYQDYPLIGTPLSPPPRVRDSSARTHRAKPGRRAW